MGDPQGSIFFFFNKFIYFWLPWVFVAARGLSLVVASGGYSLLRCTGFSLRWLLLLRSTGSRHAGFSSCGSWALEHRLSSAGKPPKVPSCCNCPVAAKMNQNLKSWTSLVAQWLRIRLPMQGTWVWSLVREDPSCRGATKPMCHNYWACALEPASHNCWSPRA